MAEHEAGDLRLVGLTKSFGEFTAVQPLDLTIPEGSFFALLGPSGCGKTTTLRMVAGLEAPTAGQILIGDTDITNTRAFQRNVNTVFQSYALFPHMSVIDNVSFGLKRRGDKDFKSKAQDALDLVELGHAGGKKPSQLSGGMQQRVALARALVNRPDVLLLDEPLGALDLKLRRQMQIELKRIQQEVGLTFIHVTHDQEEAMTMADTIAVMNAGYLEQLGDPATLYEHPASTFVANFLGQSNLVAATVTSQSGDAVVVDCEGQTIEVEASRSHVEGGRAWLGVRPEKISATPAGSEQHAGNNVLTGGKVSDVSFVGVSKQYLVAMPWGQELMVFEQNTGRHTPLGYGDTVDLAWSPDHAFLLDAEQDAHAGMMTPEGDE
jgi:spermidine/putrescine transport system ATP-binding protein